MQNKKENQLKIITLGQFKVSRGNRIISEETSNYRKVWLLFKYLITKRGNSFNTEIIMETLWPGQKVANINHAFRNLIYRLRKVLNYDNHNYIKLSEETYNFNFNSDYYWFDAEELESLFKTAQNQKLSDELKAIKTYKKILTLYKGDYLPKLVYTDWVSLSRGYYHNLYLNSVLEVVKLLSKFSRYEEIKEICEQVFNYELFEEQLHLIYIDTLIKLDRKGKAKKHFEYVTSIFNQELGLEPSPDMQSLLTQISPEANLFSSFNLQDFNLENLKEELALQDKQEGAFLCEPSIFRQLCRLEQVRAKRSGESVFLCSLILTLKDYSLPSEKKLEEKINSLQQVILTSLRKGDIVTKRKENEYFLLLSDLDSEQVDRVLQRIKDRLKKRISLEEFILHNRQISL